MADKQITVAVPEERVPEFYAWFARFLEGGAGAPPTRGHGPWGRRGPGRHPSWAHPWSADDVDEAAWLYGRSAPPARRLFDLLLDAPGERLTGRDIASRLGLDAGTRGVAGILAWPGRYARRLERAFPISVERRPDGDTDFWMAPEVVEVFRAGRERVRGSARPER